MRGVSGISAARAAARARGGARPAGGFSVDGAGANDTAKEAAAASGSAAVGLSLLSVQENGGREGRDAVARRRASAILDELRGLQTELLGREPDPARLARLAALGAGEEGADPALRDAVRAVALRARIELALRSRQADMDRSTAVP